MNQTVLTVNFSKLALAFQKAIADRQIVGVKSPDGVGFKYALNCFAEKHYLKILYCTVNYSESLREVFVELVRNLCNAKFSNLDYRKTTIFDLTRVINNRLTDGEACLLCIDKCSNLKPAQLKYFIQFLRKFDKPIGIVFRMNEHYLNRLHRNKKQRDQYNDLVKVVDEWRVLEKCSTDEIKDIAVSKNIGDPMLLNDLIEYSRGDLSLLNKGIARIRKLKPSQNLSFR